MDENDVIYNFLVEKILDPTVKLDFFNNYFDNMINNIHNLPVEDQELFIYFIGDTFIRIFSDLDQYPKVTSVYDMLLFNLNIDYLFSLLGYYQYLDDEDNEDNNQLYEFLINRILVNMDNMTNMVVLTQPN